jgi:single-stranded DNA-binding protein
MRRNSGLARKATPSLLFGLAVNERWKDGDSAPRECVEWFHVVCFGRMAEVCGDYLNKGKHGSGKALKEKSAT